MKKGFLWILLLIMIVSTMPVQGAWYDFLNPFKTTYDTTEYDDCVDVWGASICGSTYCNGQSKNNKDKIFCNYENDANRLFEAQLYPATCDELNKWNDTEEISFIFGVNVDSQDSPLNSRICQGDSEFVQFQHRDSYRLPYEVLNAGQSYQNLYLDMFGAIYLEKPSKSKLNDIYGNVLPDINLGTYIFNHAQDVNYRNDLEYLYDTVKTTPMNDQIFSLLNCEIDCDYTGVNDNDINIPVGDDGKKGGNTLDYTKSTIFFNLAHAETWANVTEADLDSSCNYWANLFGTSECVNDFANSANLLSYYRIINRLEADIDYAYHYSNTNNVVDSYSCSYPKEDYSNSEVTTQVTCNIGKTWEGILFSPDYDDLTWDQIGITECDDNNQNCVIHMTNTFFLNSTSGNINYIDSEFTGTNLTLEESVEQFIDDTSGILDYLTNINEDITSNIPGSSTYNDKNVAIGQSMIDVVDSTIELSKYVFSFILLVVYFIEIFLFIGIFQLIISSFNSLRKAVKELFGLNKEEEK